MPMHLRFPSFLPFDRFVGACLLVAATISLLLATTIAGVTPARADSKAPTQIGGSTGLPLPRYVSIKSGALNMRRGPDKDHVTVWEYRKAGLPLEITGEFENWRKVRDWEGSEGWVFHTLLSGRRTAMIAPWKKDGLVEIRKEPAASAPLAARLGPRVVTRVHTCNKQWCKVSGKGFEGYVDQKSLWGVYPDERIK